MKIIEEEEEESKENWESHLSQALLQSSKIKGVKVSAVVDDYYEENC